MTKHVFKLKSTNRKKKCFGRFVAVDIVSIDDIRHGLYLAYEHFSGSTNNKHDIKILAEYDAGIVYRSFFDPHILVLIHDIKVDSK